MKAKFLYIIFSALITLTVSLPSHGQNVDPKVIQFSGIILAEDSLMPLPGVHVYVPKYWRGTTTGWNGFFSMPVVDGDIVVISYLGYEKKSFKIDASRGESQSVFLVMRSDTTYLPIADIYPTEKQLKNSILTMRTPYESEYIAMLNNMNAQSLLVRGENMPMDASMNSRYYMNNPYYTTNLNPFAWVSFIKSLKNKKK